MAAPGERGPLYIWYDNIYVYIFIVCHLTFINSIGLYIVSTLSINILIKKCDIFLNTFDLDNINARGIKPNAIRSEKSRNGTRWILWNWVIFHLKIWSMELVVQWQQICYQKTVIQWLNPWRRWPTVYGITIVQKEILVLRLLSLRIVYYSVEIFMFKCFISTNIKWKR